MNILHQSRLHRLAASGLAALGLYLVADPSLAVPADAAIDMKLLVLTSQTDDPAKIGDAPELEAVKAILDRIGIPYEVYGYDTNSPTLPALELVGTNHAKYQGIILPVSDSRYLNPFNAGATLAQAIQDYQFKYGVRVVSFYTWPGDTGCLQATASRDTTTSPLNTTLTAAGLAAFPYMKAGSSALAPLTVKNAWTYLSGPASSLPNGAVVTPLLQGTGLDGTIQTVMATCTFANSAPLSGYNLTRDILALTFDNNPYLIHSMTLSYGVINWLTKGVFLGERHAYLTAQPDDIGIPDDIFPYTIENDQWFDVRTTPWTPLPGCPLGGVSGKTGITPCEYRLTGADFDKAITWQTNVRTKTANAGNLRLEWPFNGEGFTKKYGGQGLYPPDNPSTTRTNENETLDTLTQEIAKYASEFRWISHTYDHALLDYPMTYGGTLDGELNPNQAVRNKFGFVNYSNNILVTPEISGLYNPSALQAMMDFGTVYVVSDTSKPTPPAGSPSCLPDNNGAKWPLPPFNSGKQNCVNPAVYEIPRYPTSLFYNVSTPDQWVSEYNFFYGANGIDPTRWGVDQTYSQVLDKTSDMLLSYLLTYDLRPLMFHQSNLRAYNKAGQSLLGDLINNTLSKYNGYYQNLPILSLGQKDIGDRMKRRQAYNESGVTGVLMPGQAIVVSATNGSGQEVVVPLTGVSALNAPQEIYGGQTISSISLTPANNYQATLTPPPAW